MKTLVIICFMVVITSILYGQEMKKYKLTTETPVNEQIDKKDQYVFPDFVKGSVLLKSNQTAQSRCNYNILLDAIEYIGSDGKVYAVANPAEIVLAAVGNKSYVYQRNGYYELLQSGNLKLLLKVRLVLIHEAKAGAYGSSSATSSVTEISSVLKSGNDLKLPQTGEYSAYQDSSFWISDGKKLLTANSARSYEKLLSKFEAQISEYIAANSIDLKLEADLKKLVGYCNSLK